MFTSLFSIFIIIVAGYLLRHFSVLKKSWLTVLNGFVYYIALPALVVHSIAAYDWQSEQLGTLLFSNLLFIVFASFAVVALTMLLPISHKNKAVVMLIALTGNTVYLGIPLVNELVGGSFSSPLNGPITAISVIQLVGSLLVLLIVFEFYLLGSRNYKRLAKHLVKNPLIISAMAGILVALVGGLQGKTGELFGEPLQMVAVTASPLALLALGGFIHGLDWRKTKIAIVISPLVLKMIVLPLIAYVLFSNISAEKYIVDTSVLMASMPVAVTAFVLADEYKLKKENVAVAIMFSTIVAPIVTLIFAAFLGL